MNHLTADHDGQFARTLVGGCNAPAIPGTGMPADIEEMLMEDLMWLGFIVAMLAATLVYVRLCDNA